ncbi:MAG: DNA methyltransferase [Thermoplasmataceae archaeon]
MIFPESLCSCPDLYWHGMYQGNSKYQKYRVNEANSHPAKMSMVLADYILKHLEKLNLISPGSTIIDFMAGQGTTGIIAELHGYKFIGIELEEHFIDLINGYDCNGTNETVVKTKDKDGNPTEKIVYGKCGKYNHGSKGKEKHDPHFMPMNKQSTAKALNREPSWTIIQGDARKMSEILNVNGAGVISPPYGGIEIGKGLNTKPPREGHNDQAGRSRNAPSQIATTYTAIVSPPYAQMIGQMGGDIPQNMKVGISTLTARKYSESPTNIGNLKDITGIVSPPYGLGEGIGHSDNNPGKIMDEKRLYTRYGKHEDQIGNLKDSTVAGITSPPYANRMDGGMTREGYSHIQPYDSTGKPDDYRKKWPTQRGSTNIGNLMDGTNHQDSRETYVGAMLKVYQEAYKSCISPLVVVTKNPTKNHQLRRLDLDTIKLLEMSGYKIIDYHRAILFKTIKQQTLFGETNDVHKGQISFFKRVSLKNGNVAAQWEDIIFAVRDK